MVKEKEKMLKSIPSIRPIKKPKNSVEYLSGFGYRKHPIFKILKMHGGIDFSAEIGTAVYATGNGRVQQIIQKADGYGKHIVIDHGYNFLSVYAHLSEMNVNVGSQVKRGQIIGRVGNSGGVAPHLHYEIQYKRKRVNPLYFCRDGMTADEFNRFADMVSKENQAMSIHQ
jgi:murein DD-endopeptidase MepM/ murein hydrolase activator NlpD